MLACNVGKTDKIIRVIVGIIILAAGFYLKSWWGLIGIVPVLTAVFGRCGLYYLINVNTVKKSGGEA